VNEKDNATSSGTVARLALASLLASSVAAGRAGTLAAFGSFARQRMTSSMPSLRTRIPECW